MSVQTSLPQGTRATRLAALAGVVFVALLALAYSLTSGAPSTSASAAKIQHYYLTHHNHQGSGAFLIALSVVFGLFFFGYMRAYFRAFPGLEWLASIYFAGAVVFALCGAASAGLGFAVSDHPKALSAQSLQLLNTLASDLTWPFLSIGLAVMYLAAGFIIYRSRALPVWLAWASLLFGVLAATEFLAFIPFLGTTLWVLYVSIIMATRNPSLSDTTITLPDSAAQPRALTTT